MTFLADGQAVSPIGKLQLVSHSRLIHLITIVQGAGYGFGAGQVSNEPDLKITLRDGSQFSVVIAGAMTLGDVKKRIEDASISLGSPRVRLDLDKTESRLKLVDLTAQMPGNRLKVEASVSASRFVRDRNKRVIELPDRTSPAAADLGLEGEVPDTFTLTFTEASDTPFTTAPILSGATSQDILDALGLALNPQGLPAGRDSFVSVTGDPGGPFTVVFAPGLGAVNDLTFVSATGMTAGVKTTVPGRRGDTSAVSAVQVITPSPAAAGSGVALVGSTLAAGPLSDQFYVLAGSGINVNAKVSAANINLTASLGLLSFQIKNGGADFTVDAGLTLNPVGGRGDNKVRLSDLLNSGILSALSPTFAYGGSGSLPVDTSLLSFLPKPKPELAVNFALGNQPGSLKPNFTLDVANFDKFLGAFRNLSASQIVRTALRKLVSVLQNSNLQGLNTKIPLINKTPNEVLGIADGILQAGQEFLNGPDYSRASDESAPRWQIRSRWSPPRSRKHRPTL